MKTIFFDVMSTLVYDPFYVDLPAAFGVSLSELLQGRDRYAWLEFERAEITQTQFFERFFRDRAASDGPLMVETIVNNYRYLEGIENLLLALQGRARLTTLSNYPDWFELLEQKLNLSQYMETLFVSYQLGVRKPNPNAYLMPMKQLQVLPEDCIFVDDRKENCDAAIGVGMEAIVFENAIQLRTELERLGVL